MDHNLHESSSVSVCKHIMSVIVSLCSQACKHTASLSSQTERSNAQLTDFLCSVNHLCECMSDYEHRYNLLNVQTMLLS